MDKSYYPLVVIAACAIALIVAVALFLLLPIQQPYIAGTASSEIPTLNITLYAGEISDTQYGFGTEPNKLSTPGPTLRFKTSDLVNLTVINIGKMPHAFQITNDRRSESSVVFDAAIGSVSNPLQQGESGSVVFNPNIVGTSFFYTSPISGQTEKGLWGTVTIIADYG